MKILITDVFDEAGIELLRKSGFEVVEDFTITHGSLIEKIKDFDALIVRSRTKVTKDVIEAGKRLKVIGRSGAGLDNIDLDAAKTSQIEVVSAAEAVSVSAAELAFGLLLSLFRKILLASTSMKEGKWEKTGLMGHELRGQTIGIVGCGRVGLQVAKFAIAFQMNVLGYSHSESGIKRAEQMGIKTFGPSRDDLYSMLPLCDIVTIHIPLRPENYRFFGKKEFLSMKKGSYFINTSRGAIVDENALLKALNENRIAGAALDVFEAEPPITGTSYSLSKHPNVISTPHIGATTQEAQHEAAIMVVEKIIEILKK